MSYTITVTRTELETVKRGHEWAIIDKDANGKEQRGYTPEYETTKPVEIEILKQVVDDMDIKLLILAINNMLPDQSIALSITPKSGSVDE